MVKISAEKLLVNVGALVLMALCFKTVYAGIPAYQSSLAYKKGDFKASEILAQTAYERGERDPLFLELRARGIEERALKSGSAEELRQAAKAYQEVFSGKPVSGKVFLKQTRLEIRALETEGRLTADSWRVLEKKLLTAQSLQPGNAWTAFMAGSELLKRRKLLTAEKKEKAFELIKQSAEWDPQAFIEPVLGEAFRLSLSADELLSLIPSHYEGYLKAAQVFQESEMWPLWSRVYKRMLIYREKAYAELCEKGERELKEGRLREALEVFKKAFWLDPVPGRAYAGQALCLFYLEGESYKEAEAKLEKALEEEESLGELGTLLQSPEAPFLGNYLKGLLAYADGRYEEASELFRKVAEEKKYRDYYEASAEYQSGKTNDFLNRIESKMKSGTANTRELLLLQAFRPDLNEEIEKLLKSALTFVRPARAWWDDQSERRLLGESQKSGMLISLSPGQTQIVFAARMKAAASHGAGLLFRLSGKTAASVDVSSSEKWQAVSFTVDSPGGKYWLGVERLPGRNSSQEQSLVELGQVKFRLVESRTAADLLRKTREGM